MKISDNYIIRDYKKGDEEGITDLFESVFGKVMTVEQWRWKYLRSNKINSSKTHHPRVVNLDLSLTVAKAKPS